MSVAASRWALERLEDPDCTLSRTARGALLVLAIEANYRTGAATTGADRLGKLLGGIHRDTVWRAVRELRAWPWLPSTEVRGRGIRWLFPAGADVHTVRADADPALSTPSAWDATTVRVGAEGPSAPTRIKGVGTDVEDEGAPRTSPDAVQEQRESEQLSTSRAPARGVDVDAGALWRAARDAERDVS